MLTAIRDWLNQPSVYGFAWGLAIGVWVEKLFAYLR